MAQSSKEKLSHHARDFRDKLEALGCPYTEGVDDSWVIDLLFKPGEHRIRLLQWLFSKFDSRLHEVLDPQFVNTDTKMDSRIQRLLYVGSSLGMCGPDDADLIRGVGSTSKQLAFIDQLLDLVYIMDKSEDPQARSMKSPGMVSEGTNVKEQFYSDCWFMDSLADQEKLNTVLMSEAKLLPPDINKQLELRGRELEQQGQQAGLEIPDMTKLQDTVDALSRDLGRQQDILEQLKRAHEMTPEDPQSVENIQRTLRLVLSELSQLLIGFSYCYDNEIRQWCNKSPPQLNELGPAFKRIHGLLDHFVNMLSGTDRVRASHKTLCQHIPEQVHDLSANLNPSTDGSGVVRQVQECISVLEDSLLRSQTSTSNQTHNTSVISGLVRLR